MTHSCTKFALPIRKSITWLFLIFLVTSVRLAQTLHEGEQQTNPRSHISPCARNWLHLGQSCFKLHNSPKDYSSAKGKCQNIGAHLAYIEDESMKEKETTNPSPSSVTALNGNIISFLTAEQKRGDSNPRQYYVSLSNELINQHKERMKNGFHLDFPSGEPPEHMDSETPVSDLWLPRGDPSLPEGLAYWSDKPDKDTAFLLAFSRTSDRWGIVPVQDTRKASYICERSRNDNQHPPSTISTSAPGETTSQQQSLEARRTNEPRGQIAGLNPQASSNPSSTQYRPPEREVLTASPPIETSSVLFRDVPQDQSIVLGSTAEMRCSRLESDTSLSWTFNGKNLTQTNRIRVHLNGTLRIEHVRNTDDGNYTCTIHSAAMSESKTARLEIIERPHQPEYISADLLDKLSTSVRLKWTAGFNGNSPILKYLAEMRTVDSDYVPENSINSIMQSNLWEIAKANISADQTSVIVTDLKPAKKYIFRIRATNRVGTGDPSLPTREPIEIPAQPPNMAPENLIGTPKSSTSIVLQWSPPPLDSHNGPLKGYKIRHKLAGYASDSDWYTTDVLDAAHSTFLLEDLIIWQNYEIQIAAENDRGVGPFSSSIFVRTKEGRPDKGPRSVSAQAVSSTSIKVNWIPPPPQHINGLNQGYKVQVWGDVLQTQLIKEMAVAHNTISPNHSTTVDGLLPYSEYWVSIKCFTTAGDGPPNDDIISVKTKPDLPEAVPSLEFTDVLDKSLRVVWKPPKRINGELDFYTLEYSETLAQILDKKIQRKYSASVNEAKITDLTPQTSYTFRIYPHTSVGRGPGTTNETKTRVPPVLPESPTNLVHTNVGPNSVVIHFDPGFDGNAVIERWIAEALSPSKGDYAPRWQTIYISTNHSQDNSVTVRNLRPFSNYRIRLTPVNVVGPAQSPSEPTSEFQTSQVEPEQPPRDLVIDDVKATSVLAHWSSLASSLWLGTPLGYNLTWTEANNSTVLYHFINDTRTDSYHVRDLEEFTDYIFRIFAVNEAGSSPPSEPITITTLEDVPSSCPTNVTSHVLSSSAISVDWNSVPRRHRNGIIRGYRIQYQALSPDATLQHKTVEDNSTRHVTITDLKPSTAYHLAVAAITSVGDGVYSPVMTIQTLEDTPGMPQNLSVPSTSQTSVRILWDPPENPNGEILGYRVNYHILNDNTKEASSYELHANERTFKATNLKPDTPYVFTISAKTKVGWGPQASTVQYTYDSELRANLPFFRESWFVVLCASSSFVITIIVTALLFIQTKSYKYKHDNVKSTSHDQLGDAGFTIDDDANHHYNNRFGLLTNGSNYARYNGALSQSTANFTLPKSPPRPHPGSVAYSEDEGDDDVFEDVVNKPARNVTARNSNYDSSGDSLTEKPSEISSSTAPESESADDEYMDMANKHFVNHYANVNGALRGQKSWKKGPKGYSSHRTKPKLPQRPAPSVPQVPADPSSSGSDNPVPGTSGLQAIPSTSSVYGESVSSYKNQPPQPQPIIRGNSEVINGTSENINPNTQAADLLNSHMVNLNGGRIIVNNMAGSRAPLPGFTSFV